MSRVEATASPPDNYTISQSTPMPMPGRTMHQHPADMAGMGDYQNGGFHRNQYAQQPHYASSQQAHPLGSMQQPHHPAMYYMPVPVPSNQGHGNQQYGAQDMLPMVPHTTLAEITHHNNAASLGNAGRQPTAIHVQLPPDLPEDGAQSGRCLQDLLSLRDEWQLLSNRKLPIDKAESEAKPLMSRTTHVVGSASQSAITRQEMFDLLVYAAEVLKDIEQHQGAASFVRLADNVALACPTRSSLITNIMHGGHQTLTGGKQLVTAKPSTHVQATLGAKVHSASASKSLAHSFIQQVRNQPGILQLVGAAAAGLVGLGLAGKMLRVGRGSSHDFMGLGGAYHGKDKRKKALYERRRMQCENSNKSAHEYARKAYANRWNLLWREEIPHNSCVMPHDNLPWSPEHSLW